MNTEIETKFTIFDIVDLIHDLKGFGRRSMKITGIVSNHKWLVLYE